MRTRRYSRMGALMDNNSTDTVRLIERVRRGIGKPSMTSLAPVARRLRRMVEMRLDRRLQARLDASDVIQEAYVEVADAPGGIPAPSEAAVVPLAAAGGRRTADEAAPAPPRHADARRRPGGVAVPRSTAGGQLGGAGRPAARQAHLADPGGRARRTRCSACRRRSTRSTRSTARSCRCGTSRS